jgi:hypothetical protein
VRLSLEQALEQKREDATVVPISGLGHTDAHSIHMRANYLQQIRIIEKRVHYLSSTMLSSSFDAKQNSGHLVVFMTTAITAEHCVAVAVLVNEMKKK